jgi:hypothetical protein
MISFLDIAGRMDEVAPIGSLRELAARHRWEGAAPPAEISLARLAARHLDPTTTTHQLLWYNTYLIHGFELKLCNLLILGRLLEEAGLNARDVVLELALDPGELVDRMGIAPEAFGYSQSELEKKFSDVVDDLLGLITFGTVSLSDILDAIDARDIVRRFGLSVEDILNRVGLDPLEILVEFCELALGFISSRLNMPALTATYYVTGEAPDRPARAKEIGAMVGAQYAVAALCEVFEPDRQDDVEQQAGASGRPLDVAKGAAADGEFASSGLMTLAFDGRLLSSEHIEFSNQGDRLRDADAWSRKGVLRTVLDLGHERRVELYSTHLFNGGGILEFDPADPNEATLAGLFPKLTPEERLAIQLQQVDEAVAYITATHQADHVAMLVGDFNIDANEPADYAELVKRMAGIELIDLWPFWAQRGPSLKQLKPRGDTTHPAEVCAPPEGPYCGEPAQPNNNKTERIDFIWVERPKATHSFVLDITRVRRRPFSRGGSTSSHLSDHLGLDFRLIASPRIHTPADPGWDP